MRIPSRSCEKTRMRGIRLEEWVQTTNFRSKHPMICIAWNPRKFEVAPHFSDTGIPIASSDEKGMRAGDLQFRWTHQTTKAEMNLGLEGQIVRHIE